MNETQTAAIRKVANTMFPAGSWLVAIHDSGDKWRVRMYGLTRERAEDALEWYTDASVYHVDEWDIPNGRPKA